MPNICRTGDSRGNDCALPIRTRLKRPESSPLRREPVLTVVSLGLHVAYSRILSAMSEPWVPTVYFDARPKSKNLTTNDQVDILNLLKEGASAPYLARIYDRSVKTIRRIQTLETVIRRKYANSGGGVRKPVANNNNKQPTKKNAPKKHFPKRIGSNDITLIKVEQVLEAWLRDSYQADVELGYAEIREKALALYAKYKPAVEAKPGEEVVFKASKSWLYRFKKRLQLNNFNRTFLHNDDDIIEIDDDDGEDDYEDVALVVGIAGACRCEELIQMKTEHVEDLGNKLLITLPDSKTQNCRSFIVTHHLETFKKYVALRPLGLKNNSRFFYKYTNGKAYKQFIGIHKLGSMPKEIAFYLKLSNVEEYTGHCFRRTSMLLANYGVVNTTFKRMNEEDNSGPSTSAHSSSRNDMNESVYSITDEDSAAEPEDMFHDEGDLDDEVDDDGDDKKMDMFDMNDTGVLQDEVESLTVGVNPQYPTPIECDLFGEYIAKHLQQLPVDMALKLQSGIQSLVMQTRLEYIRQHPSEAPNMVKVESPPPDEDDPNKTRDSATTPTNEPAQNCTEKRTQDTDTPGAKRFKPNAPQPEVRKSNTTTTRGQQKQNKRTDCTVFAEHIAVQLEQLPEELSLQLQSDIYALITQACEKPSDEDAPNRVKIKAENIEVTPTEIIDEYYETYEDA